MIKSNPVLETIIDNKPQFVLQIIKAQ